MNELEADLRRQRAELEAANRQLESQARAMEASGSESLNRFRQEADDELRRLKSAHAEEVSRLRSEATAAELAARRSQQALEDDVRRLQLDNDSKQRQLDAAAAAGSDSIDAARFTRIQREWEDASKRVQASHDMVVQRLKADVALAETSAKAESQRHADDIKTMLAQHAEELSTVRNELFAAKAAWATERASLEDALRKAVASKDDEIRALKLELMVARADGQAKVKETAGPSHVPSPDRTPARRVRGSSAAVKPAVSGRANSGAGTRADKLEAEIQQLQRELDQNREGLKVEGVEPFEHGNEVWSGSEDDDRDAKWSSPTDTTASSASRPALAAFVEKELSLLKRASAFTRKQRHVLARRYQDLRREKDEWKAEVDALGLRSNSDSRKRVLRVCCKPCFVFCTSATLKYCVLAVLCCRS
jgi:hypothetical protein